MMIRLRPHTILQNLTAFVGGQTFGNDQCKNLGSAARILLPVAVTCCLFPNAASAEGRCPPGMFETGSRDFIACAPIPGYGQSSQDSDYDSGPSSQGSSARQYADSSMATAVHMDSSGVWGTAGHRSPDAAKKRVMDACAAEMGAGCVYSEAWTGDVVIAVALDGGGEPWPEGGPTKAEAEQQALKTCMEKSQAWGCNIVSGFKNVLIPAGADQESDYSRDYFPASPPRRQFAMLAWPETPTIASQRKAWLISGRQSFEASKKELLARCQADSGGTCVLGPGVGNGKLVHYVNKRGQGAWVNAAGIATPLARIEEMCAPDEKPCRQLAVYDAATPRLQVVADPEPTRGYVSAAWPAVPGTWNRLAIVTGRPSVAVADADAIALCESQSKLRCELYLDSPDKRISMFMGVYLRPNDIVQISFGTTIEDLEERAAQSCARSNVSCTNRAIIDLSERGEITPTWKD